jgi:hypothetical protein
MLNVSSVKPLRSAVPPGVIRVRVLKLANIHPPVREDQLRSGNHVSLLPIHVLVFDLKASVACLTVCSGD